MVPQVATATITGDLPETFATQATAWADEAGVKLTLTLGNPTTIEVVGKGAHAQEPKDGKMLALTWPIYWQTCHLIQPVKLIS